MLNATYSDTPLADLIASKHPVFARATTISKTTFEDTQGRKAKMAWMNLFNNCNVISFRGDLVLVHASHFAAAGIAREGGFDVFATDRPGHYVVNTSRVGCQIADRLS